MSGDSIQKLTPSKRTELVMDTLVTIQINHVAHHSKIEAALDRAFSVFRYVESVCSRFTPESEVMKLSKRTGVHVPVSPVLFQALQFALEIAKVTDGEFDPTVGARLEKSGFNRHYLTQNTIDSNLSLSDQVSYRSVELHPEKRTVLLKQPLILDLGAVVKGLAVDLAAKELQPFDSFCIEAGGDLFVHGLNQDGELWQIGIEHPLEPNKLIGRLELTDGAVCTSAPFKRLSPLVKGGSHLVNPKTDESVHDVISTTVVAPFAMLADAFSTAVFISGSNKGLALLNQEGLDGLLVTHDFKLNSTKGMENYAFKPFSID